MAEVREVRQGTLEWKINNFLEKTNDDDYVQSNKFYMGSETFRLDCDFEKEGDDRFYTIYLRRAAEARYLYRAFCTISLIDRRGMEIQVTKRRTTNQTNNKCYYIPMMRIRSKEVSSQKDDLLTDGALTFRFSWKAVDDCDLLEQSTRTLLDSESDDSTKLCEKLSKDFAAFHESKTFADTILMVGDEEFPVHRAVLSARSSVFAAMFKYDTSESRRGEINIKDVDAAVMSDFLYYVYSGKIRGLTSTTAVQMFAVADKYAVMEMRDLCLKFLQRNLTMENVTGAAILAYLHGISDLENKVIRFIEMNSKELLENNSWNEFVKTNPSLTSNYLHHALISYQQRRRRKRNN